MIPPDLLLKSTVYDYFAKWRDIDLSRGFANLINSSEEIGTRLRLIVEGEQQFALSSVFSFLRKNQMLRRFTYSLLLVAFTVLPSRFCAAQLGEQGDVRVKRLLDRLDYSYTLNSDGDFRLLNSVDGGRSHVVIVNSNTSEYGNMEIREVWAIGYIANGILSSNITRSLLAENRLKKLGAWEIATVGDREAAIFTVRIAANADEQTIRFAILAAQKSADELERALLGTDDL